MEVNVQQVTFVREAPLRRDEPDYVPCSWDKSRLLRKVKDDEVIKDDICNIRHLSLDTTLAHRLPGEQIFHKYCVVPHLDLYHGPDLPVNIVGNIARFIGSPDGNGYINFCRLTPLGVRSFQMVQRVATILEM